jgi:hypothetical protein
MSELPLNTNKGFYGMSFFTQKLYPEYNKNRVKVHEKKKGNGNGVLDFFTLHEKYKKKYNMFMEHDDVTEHTVFKKIYKLQVHSLTLSITNLELIKYLPKDLLTLIIYGSSEFINFPVSVVPKKIVSMIFLHSAFPFNGQDLSKLKNLKMLSSSTASMSIFPKLPKTMEYISFKNSGIGFNFPDSLNGFKLSAFPKLKYFDLSGNNIKKKDIPQEWKDAKRAKKIFIKF